MMFVETKADDPDLFTIKEFKICVYGIDKWRVEAWQSVEGELAAIHMDLWFPPRKEDRLDAARFCAEQVSLYRQRVAPASLSAGVRIKHIPLPELVNLEPRTYEVRVQHL